MAGMNGKNLEWVRAGQGDSLNEHQVVVTLDIRERKLPCVQVNYRD